MKLFVGTKSADVQKKKNKKKTKLKLTDEEPDKVGVVLGQKVV